MLELAFQIWDSTLGKCEVTLSGPYAHLGMTAGDERITEIVSAARDEAGDPESFQIMVDVQYTWDDAERATWTGTARVWSVAR